MSTLNSGVFVLYVDNSIIEDVFEHKTLEIDTLLEGMLSDEECAEFKLPAQSEAWQNYPYANLVLKSLSPKGSALVRVLPGCTRVELLRDYGRHSVFGLTARNKEQNMLINALMDIDILCVAVEGKAGSGKTICTIAAALELLKDKNNPYERVVLSRPMSAVGAPMGALPGDAVEKFMPYAGNYISNFEFLMGGKRGLEYMKTMVDRGHLEFMPLKLIGGVSWHNTIVIADEIQSLTPEQMYALVTRPADGSKLVLMGDSAQRYGRKTKIEDTGLYQWANNELVYESDLAAYIKLVKQERSGLADLAYRVFIDDED